MIVPMKKVSLVVLEKERKQALKSLRSLGVVHVEEVEGTGETLASLNEAKSKVERAHSILSEIKLSKSDAKKAAKTSLKKEEALALSAKVLGLVDEKKAAQDAITADTLELARFASWGDFDPKDFDYLKEKGIHLSLYEISTDKYSAIGEEARTLLVNKDKSQSRFLLISDEALPPNERPEGLGAEAFQLTLPRCSTGDLKKAIGDNNARISKIEKEIESLAVNANALKASFPEFDADVEFENLYSGMGCEEATEENAEKIRLSWLTGYVPTEDLQKVTEAAKNEKWAVVSNDPTEEDNVPTKLKNNKFIGLIYPVTDFLGTVPGYHEYDISNWFLLFFTVFFGMIFGDAGYGALMVVIAVLGMFSSIVKRQKPAAVMSLLLLLGLMTMVWGAVTCTWFGLAPEQLPDFIKSLSVPALSNASSVKEGIVPGFEPLGLTYEMWVKENLQIFCFTLALIQLSVAHFKGMIRYRKSLKCLGEFGSNLMLWGMYYVVLSMVVDSVRFPLNGTPEGFAKLLSANNLPELPVPLATICLGLIGFGFFLSFVFANYDGSIGKSILESLKGIVSVLLGVVNIFSDIVSYIRLWAVALAGGAISATVNDMAGPMLGGFIIFLGVLLLVFGHGLNMILNVLSVIVHGVRLNTLEFSNHLGMTWAGYKYKPFAEVKSA